MAEISKYPCHIVFIVNFDIFSVIFATLPLQSGALPTCIIYIIASFALRGSHRAALIACDRYLNAPPYSDCDWTEVSLNVIGNRICSFFLCIYAYYILYVSRTVNYCLFFVSFSSHFCFIFVSAVFLSIKSIFDFHIQAYIHSCRSIIQRCQYVLSHIYNLCRISVE